MFVFRIIIFDFPVVAKELYSVLKSISFTFLSGFQELLRRPKIAMTVVVSNTICCLRKRVQLADIPVFLGYLQQYIPKNNLSVFPDGLKICI